MSLWILIRDSTIFRSTRLIKVIPIYHQWYSLVAYPVVKTYAYISGVTQENIIISIMLLGIISLCVYTCQCEWEQTFNSLMKLNIVQIIWKNHQNIRIYLISSRLKSSRLISWSFGSPDLPAGWHCSWCLHLESIQYKLKAAHQADFPR